MILSQTTKTSLVCFQFQRLKIGYEATTAEKTLGGYRDYLENKKNDAMLPGEGARILLLAEEAIAFLNATHPGIQATRNTTSVALQIVDKILNQPYSLINETVSA